MERPKIDQLHDYTNSLYLNYIPRKIEDRLNENYWYNLNLEFSKTVYSEGLESNIFDGYEGFLHDFSINIEDVGKEIHNAFQRSINFRDEVDSKKQKSIKVRFNNSLSNFDNLKKDFGVFPYVLDEIIAHNQDKGNKIKAFINLRVIRFFDYLEHLGLQIEGLNYFKLESNSPLKSRKSTSPPLVKNIPEFKEKFKKDVFDEGKDEFEKMMKLIPFELCELKDNKYYWKKYKDGSVTEIQMMGAFLSITEPIREKYKTNKDLVQAASKFFNIRYSDYNYSKFKKSANKQYCIDRLNRLDEYIKSIC